MSRYNNYPEGYSNRVRTALLDIETITGIKLLCADYGISMAAFFELSNLNAPSTASLSYGTFKNAMAGARLTEEQESAISRSLLTVRQELRKAGRRPLEKELPAMLTKLLKEHFDGDGAFTVQELGDLRRILNRAARRAAAR